MNDITYILELSLASGRYRSRFCIERSDGINQILSFSATPTE